MSYSTDSARIFDRCVALSGPVADLFLLDPEQRQFAETALCAERSLGLDRMAFGQVLGTIGAMIPETEAIFEAELLSKQHPELILEQAREVLMLRSLHALREINTLRATAGCFAGAATGTRGRDAARPVDRAFTTAPTWNNSWPANSTTRRATNGR